MGWGGEGRVSTRFLRAIEIFLMVNIFSSKKRLHQNLILLYAHDEVHRAVCSVSYVSALFKVIMGNIIL